MPTIRTPKQRRALAAFARQNKRTVKELREIAGTNNAPELMAQLTRNGCKWSCEIVEILERGGNVCRPGMYRLAEEHLRFTTELLGFIHQGSDQ